MHVAVDIIRDPSEALTLWTTGCVSDFLNKAVALTGLHKITEPIVVEHVEDDLLHIDGHVTIAESHIHVIVVPEKGQGWIDVFSCREVSINLVTVAAAESFGGRQFVRLIPRVELTR